MKIKIGIIFGGFSKEREVSFAGGRTVYDNLNKSLFEAVPIFVDSFGNFILLNWQYVYKGSIRDFYPPAKFIPDFGNEYQIYAESIGDLDLKQQEEITASIGKRIDLEDLPNYFDFAFLCLHGPFGEDGKIQQWLEHIKMPYSGSGVKPSQIGINKVLQKELMIKMGFRSPDHFAIPKHDWHTKNEVHLYHRARHIVGFPMVIKSATQGSSIGISILKQDDQEAFVNAINKSFFKQEIKATFWNTLSNSEKTNFVRTLCDIREGIGIPVRIADKIIYHPARLLEYLNVRLHMQASIFVESLDGEEEVLIEQFIEGKEFSCIVVQDETTGKPIALPPTEIRKGNELFDYRSKYLPGLARKITPINIEERKIEQIRQECEKLMSAFAFDVYARIDGFINLEGHIFLNDPNTTSGMMPSSFFFHQAAEIGLNPSQFLTYIIRTSFIQRMKHGMDCVNHLNALDQAIKLEKQSSVSKIKVAVLLGGFSSERHISVESGRNIYEKLSSSSKYEAIPIFLTGNESKHLLYQIPINILLKDNADDIKEKIDNYLLHPVVSKIISEAESITEKYSSKNNLAKPKALTYEDLGKIVDEVFIALHGRPGEDGAVQLELEKVGLPYNGSGTASSRITINKFETNEILRKNGLHVAEHLVVKESDWTANPSHIFEVIKNKIGFPLIAKPVDDGCSSAVKKIKTEEEFKAFAGLIFRKQETFPEPEASILKIKANEEFPIKKEFLVEELIGPKGASHFIEITGGMLTKYDKNGEVQYEVFEASEALSEGEVLSLEEKFLAGQGQNITPARYSKNENSRKAISNEVKIALEKAAKLLNVQGYCRIDAFVRVFENNRVEVIFIEVNSLPGMTPATCIFHQTAINGYKPYDFIDRILMFGEERIKRLS